MTRPVYDTHQSPPAPRAASSPGIDDRCSHHNGWGFSTEEVDNDARWSNCATSWGGHGGWWFNSCHRCFFNGRWGAGNEQGLSFWSVTGPDSATSSHIMVGAKPYLAIKLCF